MIDFDPFDKDKWLIDHCPTYIIPSFPMMGIVAVLLQVAGDNLGRGFSIDRVQLFKFIPAHKRFSLSVKQMDLNQNKSKIHIFLSGDDQEIAVASALISASAADEISDNTRLPEVQGECINPYVQGLFHGRLFQWTQWVSLGQRESQSVIEVKANNPTILLDNMLHGIPHDNLWRWCATIPQNRVAFPSQIENMRFYRDLPVNGQVNVHAQFIGFYKELEQFPYFQISASIDNQPLLDFALIETFLPKSKIGVDAFSRTEFLHLKHYVPDYGLSTYENQSTYLSFDEVKQALWFEGALACLYNSSGDLKQLTRKIAIQEHVARQLKVHPVEIEVLGWKTARKRGDPAPMYVLDVKEEQKGFKVTN